jgi:hypothetical protein
MVNAHLSGKMPGRSRVHDVNDPQVHGQFQYTVIPHQFTLNSIVIELWQEPLASEALPVTECPVVNVSRLENAVSETPSTQELRMPSQSPSYAREW